MLAVFREGVFIPTKISFSEIEKLNQHAHLRWLKPNGTNVHVLPTKKTSEESRFQMVKRAIVKASLFSADRPLPETFRVVTNTASRKTAHVKDD